MKAVVAGVVLAIVLVAACGSPSGRSIDAPGGGGGGDSGGGGDGSGSGQTSIYAHTGTDLYRVDPDTYATAHVGSFDCLNTVSGDAMTDIGIDKDGNILGVSFFTVTKIDATTAHCTVLSQSLATQFNGLSFVPASVVNQTGDDVLVGTDSTDGMVYQVNPMTGATTVIGNMGSGYMSSGDLVSVDNFGTVQTVPGTTHDVLVRLANSTFAATAIGTDTGFDMIWGLGFWKSKVFGFTNGGQIITIDPTTGVGTVVASGGPGWYGAAVTTVAPVIQ